MARSPADATRHRHADAGTISAIRDFNRLYTRQLGLLNQGFLGSKLTLTEARVLYELATRSGVTASEIAGDLQLDVAYLSRILAKFRGRGWLSRRTSDADGRRQHLRLTAAGRAAFQPLDDGARGQIANIIAPMTSADRASLVAAIGEVRRAVSAPASPAKLVIRGLKVGDIGWITHRQALLYAEEYGWDVTYEGLVAKILSDFVAGFDTHRDGAWIAEREGAIVGSVFLVKASATVGQLRLLYVEPRTRGAGIGRQLVQVCIDGARARGYRKVRLWTNDVLVSARRIYEAAGFQLTGQESHESFGKKLVGQTWELDLKALPGR
jgi:DNA-binding MarR family transcriptional regulator/N-acetylglutamate synthase-like GNAT family acetyltransferase